MTSIRKLNRRPARSLTRYASRMLGGVRRPPQPNYLAMACRALRRVIQIDNHLRPFMREQARLVEERLFHQELELALRRVYGPGPAASPRPPVQEECGKETVNERSTC